MSINLHPGTINASGHSRNLRGTIDVQRTYRYESVVHLFQRIRDESHRFAISYHQTLQRQQQTKSQIDTIPGIGPKTRAKLQKKFGGIKNLQQYSEAQIAGEIGPAKAKQLKKMLP